MDRGTSLISRYAENPLNAPPGELYGIEVEVEQFDPTHRATEARALSRYWNLKEDGSLRNNGLEFVSKFLTPATRSTAVHHLYARTRQLWAPTERTGVHVHANMLGRTLDEVLRIVTYYAFLEPLLFHYVGAAREENIFCVPWYRAPEEAATVHAALLSDLWPLRESCKYSALYCGPLRTFGTIEFRHAPTWPDPQSLTTWGELVECISRSYLLPDPIEVYAVDGIVPLARSVFGSLMGVLGLTDEEIEQAVARTGAEEVALTFQANTYKEPVPWGVPGQFYVAGQAEDSRTEWYSVAPRSRPRMEVRPLGPFDEPDDQEPESEDEEGDE